MTGIAMAWSSRRSGRRTRRAIEKKLDGGWRHLGNNGNQDQSRYPR